MWGSLLLAAVVAGCSSQPYVTPERLDRGLVIVLPGVEGRGPLNEAICDGLDAGGVDWAIELWDWTSSLGPLYNLRAEQRNRKEAQYIAGRIRYYNKEHPDRPVILLGQSGGGAMAVWTLESLPSGKPIEGAVLLAAALSPEYELDAALEGTRRGIVSFHSPLDVFFLGLGTTVTGTMDGRHTGSAGRSGFKEPNSGERLRLYAKLFQVSWEGEMVTTGNLGLHLTSGTYSFVKKYVAPLVLHEQWGRRTSAPAPE